MARQKRLKAKTRQDYERAAEEEARELAARVSNEPERQAGHEANKQGITQRHETQEARAQRKAQEAAKVAAQKAEREAAAAAAKAIERERKTAAKAAEAERLAALQAERAAAVAAAKEAKVAEGQRKAEQRAAKQHRRAEPRSADGTEAERIRRSAAGTISSHRLKRTQSRLPGVRRHRLESDGDLHQKRADSDPESDEGDITYFNDEAPRAHRARLASEAATVADTHESPSVDQATSQPTRARHASNYDFPSAAHWHTNWQNGGFCVECSKE